MSDSDASTLSDSNDWPGDRFKTHYTDKLRRRLILGGVVAVAAGVYALHRKQINALHLGHQEATYETMWSSFDEGVRYGITLAKEAIHDTSAKTALESYSFGAFDKLA